MTGKDAPIGQEELEAVFAAAGPLADAGSSALQKAVATKAGHAVEGAATESPTAKIKRWLRDQLELTARQVAELAAAAYPEPPRPTLTEEAMLKNWGEGQWIAYLRTADHISPALWHALHRREGAVRDAILERNHP